MCVCVCVCVCACVRACVRTMLEVKTRISLFESNYQTAARLSLTRDTEPLFLQMAWCMESRSNSYVLQPVVYVVLPPDMGNRIAIGRQRAYRDRDRKKISSRFQPVLPN